MTPRLPLAPSCHCPPPLDFDCTRADRAAAPGSARAARLVGGPPLHRWESAARMKHALRLQSSHTL
eukprot:scaffold20035_cov112-Isochrysis_galbana.AAC.1